MDTSKSHDHWLLRGGRDLLLLVAVAVAAGTLLMAVQQVSGPFEIDEASRSIGALHANPGLNRVMLDITSLGADVILVGAFSVLAAVAWKRTGGRWARFFALAMMGAVTLDNLVKPFVGRARPAFDRLVGGRGESFPSGHVVATTAFLFALALYLSRDGSAGSKRALWTAALVGSVLMGASRVYLGVHWPTDVLAGLVLGATWTFMCARSQGVLPERRVLGRVPLPEAT